MNAAQRLFDSIRAQLQGSADAPLPPPLPIGDVSADTATRLARFGDRLAALGAELHVATPARPAAVLVQELLGDCPDGAAAWSDAAPLAQLRAQLGRPRDLDAGAAADQLLRVEAGITTAQWGIAAAGTLVLLGADERHRLLSLLPPLHIALLPASRLLATLGETLKLLPRPLPAAVTFISGPSRTADIELQLVVGVHGPRRLCVVVT